MIQFQSFHYTSQLNEHTRMGTAQSSGDSWSVQRLCDSRTHREDGEQVCGLPFDPLSSTANRDKAPLSIVGSTPAFGSRAKQDAR